MVYIIVGIVMLALIAGAFLLGINEGRKQGELVGRMYCVKEVKLFFDKVLEMVPPNRYDDLSTQVEYFYERIHIK